MPSYNKRLLTLERLIEELSLLLARESDDKSIEEGNKFESSFSSSLSISGTRNVAFTTGSDPVFIVATIISATISQVTIDVFKEPDVSGGSTLLPFNLNDVSDKVSAAAILDNVSVNNVGQRVGATNRFFDANRPRTIKRKLAPNTTYLFQIKNGTLSSGSVSGYFTWTE